MKYETTVMDFVNIPEDEFSELKVDELAAFHAGAASRVTQALARVGVMTASSVILTGFGGLITAALTSNSGWLLLALLVSPILSVLASSFDYLVSIDRHGRRYAEDMSMSAYVDATDGKQTIYGTPHRPILRHANLSGYYEAEDSMYHVAWASLALSSLSLGVSVLWAVTGL